jgi:hypothetical protein
MTDPITGKATHWLKLFREYLPLAGIFTFVLWVFSAGFVTLFAPKVRATLGVASAEDIKAVGEAVSTLSSDIREIRTLVDIALKPDDIVIYRELPRTVRPFCVPGQDCALVIFAERSEGAVACKIIPGSAELHIAAEGREYVARAAPNRVVNNLQARPQALEPSFVMPDSIPPGEWTSFIRTFYTDCPWQQTGRPPALQDSPLFQIEVRQ